jgi:hypothetical protein
LPRAPGAFEEVVDALRAHVEQRATWAGSSFDELAAQAFDEIDPLLLPLKVAQNYVDTDEAGSLADLVANDAGFLRSGERELLDRLFGYAPIGELIQAEIDNFEQVDPPSPAARLGAVAANTN